MDNIIGGYFELELKKGKHYHNKCLNLNTVRNCLEYVLLSRKYSKIFIPYYICKSILEPIEKLGLEYEFYFIDNNLDPIFEKEISLTEALLYVNYFGLKQNTVRVLSKKYKNLIVDNSQAFFAKRVDCIDTFYSPRKFIGVSDGAYLYTDSYIDVDLEEDISFNRFMHLLKRADVAVENGYIDFKENEHLLSNQPIRKMSKLTEKILMSVDYEFIKTRRKENFLYLENELGVYNRFSFKLSQGNVPMVYPFLSNKKGLKQKLISEKIYVSTYWSDVYDLCQLSDWEYEISSEAVFLPIDQRYKKNDMLRIVEVLKKML